MKSDDPILQNATYRRIYEYIKAAREPLSSGEIGTSLGMYQGTASNCLRILWTRGLIQRQSGHTGKYFVEKQGGGRE